MSYTRRSSMLAFAMYAAVLLPFLAFLVRPILAVDITYCSSENTGSHFSSNYSHFQSVGNCESVCNADYAFGVLQKFHCWCSNYAPGTTKSKSDCKTECPGYSDERCGDLSANLFAYVEMDNRAPSGTGLPSASSTSSGTSTTNSVIVTTKTGTGSSGESEPTTITMGNSPTGESNTGSSKNHSSSLGGGGIAGVVVGSVGGVALIAGFLGFFIARRRSRTRERASYNGNVPPNGRHAGSSSTTTRMPAFTDNRLNTDTGLFNGSRRRNSDVSLQDNEDYSRPVLRLTNPD